ncbi:MAG TPA: gluconate 2-dehydrogenase subunit 3 family protein [Sphingomicrobium sp.]|nr:gluconate 2-dehydrogenase subunit 3 family protein [Sphingomicrobium sp.]
MTRVREMMGLDRRSLLSHAMLLVGGAMVPSPASAAGKLVAKIARSAPFSRTQLEIVAAYADALIPQTDTPGAIEAGVPRAINAMMRDWASTKTRAEFLSVLEALDAAARVATGQGLAALPPKKRHEVVVAFDAARIQVQERTAAPAHREAEKQALPAIAAKHLANSDGERIASDKGLHQQEKSSAGARLGDAQNAKSEKAKVSTDDPIAALAGPYIRLKDLVLTTYYLSEPGATKELRYELIPGVWEASMPLGSDRRAWAV